MPQGERELQCWWHSAIAVCCSYPRVLTAPSDGRFNGRKSIPSFFLLAAFVPVGLFDGESRYCMRRPTRWSIEQPIIVGNFREEPTSQDVW